ncbi:hypothetical protein OESDEN_11023 [Oesophagostomum dentatum]|uniref:Uncharacterized protein n=1 Tax=Oesophagostomum dentatum TaxID=61180 RepID=A0A0B1T091_OESDE|nr:hypothetical protein OESDEN_11023 [Oesophagostomum dentatum]
MIVLYATALRSFSTATREYCTPCALDDMLRPAKFDYILNSQHLIDRQTQEMHAWNPADRSLNIFVKDDDCFTFHRHPVAQSTDCIRGKVIGAFLLKFGLFIDDKVLHEQYAQRKHDKPAPLPSTTRGIFAWISIAAAQTTKVDTHR